MNLVPTDVIDGLRLQRPWSAILAGKLLRQYQLQCWEAVVLGSS